MSKWGNKYLCWSCGTKFYDLNRPEPKCPKCGADPHAAPAADKATKPAPAEDEFEDLKEVEEEVDVGGEEE